MVGARRFVTPLVPWFPHASALSRFARRHLGRAPAVLRARRRDWRGVTPGFGGVVALAASGVPFHIVAERRYDRSGDVRRLRRALAEGATVYLPQVHQVLPRVARLMAALRAALLPGAGEACSFLFLVEGRGRRAMGLHHDGDVHAFWLQLEGRRTVTIGPAVTRGTPADLDEGAARGCGWRTLDLPPGTLFHLPPYTPHAVVCHGRSLALSLTFARRRAPGRTARAPVWDVVSGRTDPRPRVSPGRLWTQVPVVAVPAPGAGVSLLTPDGPLVLPRSLRRFARALTTMPSFPRRALPRDAAPLLAHGIVAGHDLPLRIVADRPAALDGWRFA